MHIRYDMFQDEEGRMNDMSDTFTPHYTITNSITGNLELIERTAWLVQNMLIMPKHEAWFKRQVWVRRAAATTRIEGASLTEDEVDELSKRGPGGQATEDERANINALAAYEFIDYLSDEPEIEITELAIRQLNREFLKGLDEHLIHGRYRDGQNTVGPFTPPDSGDVPALMRSFSEWLQASPNDMNPIVRAGLAHIHLVAIHPFWDGNGRVGRGLATLILQRSPFHFKKLLSLESFISGIRDDYFTAIERTLGKNFRFDYDATPWLEFWVRAVMAHAMQLQMELTDWHRNREKVYAALEKANINHRQAEALIFTIKMGKITRSDYSEIAAVTNVTASRDLRRLVDTGWLFPHGAGRGRYYTADVPPGNAEAPPEQGRLELDGNGGSSEKSK